MLVASRIPSMCMSPSRIFRCLVCSRAPISGVIKRLAGQLTHWLTFSRLARPHGPCFGGHYAGVEDAPAPSGGGFSTAMNVKSDIEWWEATCTMHKQVAAGSKETKKGERESEWKEQSFTKKMPESPERDRKPHRPRPVFFFNSHVRTCGLKDTFRAILCLGPYRVGCTTTTGRSTARMTFPRPTRTTRPSPGGAAADALTSRTQRYTF